MRKKTTLREFLNLTSQEQYIKVVLPNADIYQGIIAELFNSDNYTGLLDIPITKHEIIDLEANNTIITAIKIKLDLKLNFGSKKTKFLVPAVESDSEVKKE